MKANKVHTVIQTILLGLFFAINVASQQPKKNNFWTNVTEDVMLKELAILNKNQIQNSEINNKEVLKKNNTVYLKQYGFGNVSEINQSLQTTQQVQQVGKNNYYSFYDYYNNTPIKLNVVQNGNENSLQVYGTNSLMKGAKIVQNSNNQNIIIKNYK